MLESSIQHEPWKGCSRDGDSDTVVRSRAALTPLLLKTSLSLFLFQIFLGLHVDRVSPAGQPPFETSVWVRPVFGVDHDVEVLPFEPGHEHGGCTVTDQMPRLLTRPRVTVVPIQIQTSAPRPGKKSER